MQTEPAPAFFSALRDGDTVTVRTLLSTADAQSWINYQSDLGYTPLYIAALLNQPSITEQLIVARCNIDLHREDRATPQIERHRSILELNSSSLRDTRSKRPRQSKIRAYLYTDMLLKRAAVYWMLLLTSLSKRLFCKWPACLPYLH